MKFITRISGILVLLLFLTSLIFRFMHFESWRSLMASGMLILSFGFTPLFFMDHYKKQVIKSQKLLHIFGFLLDFWFLSAHALFNLTQLMHYLFWRLEFSLYYLVYFLFPGYLSQRIPEEQQ